MNLIILITSLMLCTAVSEGVQCTSTGFNDIQGCMWSRTVRSPSRGRTGTPANSRHYYGQQVVFPDLSFNCSGLLKTWIFEASVHKPKKKPKSCLQAPQLHVWRKSTTTEYRLVHNTTVQIGTESSNMPGSCKVYNNSLEPSFPVQAGDILGIYQPVKDCSSLKIHLYPNSDARTKIFYKDCSEPLSILFTDESRVRNDSIPLVSVVIDPVPSTSVIATNTITLRMATSQVARGAISTTPLPVASQGTRGAISTSSLPVASQATKGAISTTSLPVTSQAARGPIATPSLPVAGAISTTSLHVTSQAARGAISTFSLPVTTITTSPKVSLTIPPYSDYSHTSTQELLLIRPTTVAATITQAILAVSQTFDSEPQVSFTVAIQHNWTNSKPTQNSMAIGTTENHSSSSFSPLPTVNVSQGTSNVNIYTLVIGILLGLTILSTTVAAGAFFTVVVLTRRKAKPLVTLVCPSSNTHTHGNIRAADISQPLHLAGERPGKYQHTVCNLEPVPIYEGLSLKEQRDPSSHSASLSSTSSSCTSGVSQQMESSITTSSEVSNSLPAYPPGVLPATTPSTSPQAVPLTSSPGTFPCFSPTALSTSSAAVLPISPSSNLPNSEDLSTFSPAVLPTSPETHLPSSQPAGPSTSPPAVLPLLIPAEYDKIESKNIHSIDKIHKHLKPPASPYETPRLGHTSSVCGYDCYVPDEYQRQHFQQKGRYEFDKQLYESLSHQTQQEQPVQDGTVFFEEVEKYWEPSSTASTLYTQLFTRRFREIPRKLIQITEYLGSGQFGTVNKATWMSRSGETEVAVKMMKAGVSEAEKVRFLQEAAINGQFHHPNVVTLLGVVTVGEPAMIVLELLKNGNLRKFLSHRRPKKGETPPPTLVGMLLDCCSQVACGMAYLSKKAFIHRDLAARNILVSEDFVCKVADFGMSRDLMEKSYYVSQGGPIPIKWTAPEALYYRKYTTFSDVWSYGVLMYEIWSMGKKPFSSLTNEQYIDEIDLGHRLPPPPGCPRLMYELMMDCWHPESSCRPSFETIMDRLSQDSGQLLELGATDEELSECPQAAHLCAPLETGHNMFQDIQNKYWK